MSGWEREAGRHPRFTGRAADPGPDLRNRTTCLEEARPSGTVDRAVDASAAEHPLVGCVDDRVDRDPREISFLNDERTVFGERMAFHGGR